MPQVLNIMEKSHQSEPTHINVLPEDLVLNILTLLPLQDAVKTSVLSSKWRYTWTRLPQLVFDDHFCEKSTMRTKSELIKAIYQVLLRYQGPLQEFILSLSNLERCSDIDQFILTVLTAGVKDFTLHIRKGKPYRLPASIFPYCQQLETLELRSCVFRPPLGFKGFDKLVVLVLEEVGVNGNSLSKLISNCPPLEYLRFKSSSDCGHLDIVSLNLVTFSFEGFFESICFKSTPELSDVEIYTGENDLPEVEERSQVMFSGSLPAIERLAPDNYYLKYITANRAPRSLVMDLGHVEVLDLSSICFGIVDEVVSALCIIRNSKKLLKLAVYVYTINGLPDVELEEVDGFSDVTLVYLRNVELLKVSGLNRELQFIKFILDKSPVLERFEIVPDSTLVGDQRLEFFKKVSRLSYASSIVEISFEDWYGDRLQ